MTSLPIAPRQLLTENFLLCVLGSVAGLVFGLWTVQVLRSIVLAYLPMDWPVEVAEIFQNVRLGLDIRVIASTIALAVVTTIAAGLGPAIQASRVSLLTNLNNEGSIFGRSITASRFRNALVVSQVAVCLMLLSCAGLLVRNLIRARNLDFGFEPRQIVGVQANWPVPPTDTRLTIRRIRAIAGRLRDIPGVTATCVARGGPMLGWPVLTHVGDSGAKGVAAAMVDARACGVSAGFFETFGLSVRGRTFTERDEGDLGVSAVIVSEAVARRLWPGEDAIGRSLAVGAATIDDLRSGGRKSVAIPSSYLDYRVVGVAHDVRESITDTNLAFLYFPLPPETSVISGLFIRLRDNSNATYAALARAGEAAGVTLGFNHRLETQAEERMLPFLALAGLSGMLGTLALVMSAVGLYGVMACSVSQRVREIGIRMALGATVEKIVRLLLRQGLRLVAVGVAIGLGGGALFALLLSKVIFGMGSAFDPFAFCMATLILAAVAFFASWLPARRAAKVDPVVALRAE